MTEPLRRAAVLATLSASLLGAPMQIGAAQGQVRSASGAGDEATLDAQRRALLDRLTAAERAGTMDRGETQHHRQALDTMIRSARRDLRRPPHFISAAENATYGATLAGVEAGLSRAEARADTVRSDSVIVGYTPGDAATHRRIVDATRRLRLTVSYDLPRVGSVTVAGVAAGSLARTMAAYRALRGVTSVRPEGYMQIHRAGSQAGP